MEEDRIAITEAVSEHLPPPDVVQELISIGVCARCIFRLFGVQGDLYSSSLVTNSTLLAVLNKLKCCESESNGNVSNPSTSNNLCDFKENGYCIICLGILQFACTHEQAVDASFEKTNCLGSFTTSVSGIIKAAGHAIDGFSIEISIPPAILANQRAFWIYVREKHGCQDWYEKKYHAEKISVKDALKLSIVKPLEKCLNTKCGVNPFRIRFIYSHLDASVKLQNILGDDMGCKRRKIEHESRSGHPQNGKHDNGTESDAVVRRALEGLVDSVFLERFTLPPEEVSQPCCLSILYHRMPIYIGGRYLKFSRKVSQSRWIIDDERMGEASVEEIVGNNVLLKCQGDSYKFHAAGREDIDVRMLGSGRPFLVEVANARVLLSSVDVQEITDAINNSEDKYVVVKNLQVLGSEAWEMMREGESEKQKQYAALVWISHALTVEDIEKLSSINNMEILQRTPIRVLHRRSPLERTKIIHWMKVEKINENCQYFLLHLCTQAGTYIKEFVHGDLGRTHPSIGSLLGCRAEILQLDVTDVKMDSFE